MEMYRHSFNYWGSQFLRKSFTSAFFVIAFEEKLTGSPLETCLVCFYYPAVPVAQPCQDANYLRLSSSGFMILSEPSQASAGAQGR